MSDSLPQPDDATQHEAVPAQTVPTPAELTTLKVHDEPIAEPMAEVLAQPIAHDPAAQAADRAGFKFLAIGFALFFALIAICAGIVALVMKSMGI